MTTPDTRKDTTTDTPTPTPTKIDDPTPPNNNDDKTNVGAIAGGVVGGVAALSLAAVAIFWIMRRNKNKQASTLATAPAAGGAGPYPSEAKPANVEVGGYYPPEGQHSPPVGHEPAKYQNVYDPNQGVGQMGVAPGGYNLHTGTMYPGSSASPPPMSAGLVPPYEATQGGGHQYRNELPS